MLASADTRISGASAKANATTPSSGQYQPGFVRIAGPRNDRSQVVPRTHDSPWASQKESGQKGSSLTGSSSKPCITFGSPDPMEAIVSITGRTTFRLKRPERISACSSLSVVRVLTDRRSKLKPGFRRSIGMYVGSKRPRDLAASLRRDKPSHPAATREPSARKLSYLCGVSRCDLDLEWPNRKATCQQRLKPCPAPTSDAVETTDRLPADTSEPIASDRQVGVSVGDLLDGHLLKCPILGQNGVLLLAENSAITPRFKELLKARGVDEADGQRAGRPWDGSHFRIVRSSRNRRSFRPGTDAQARRTG